MSDACDPFRPSPFGNPPPSLTPMTDRIRITIDGTPLVVAEYTTVAAALALHGRAAARRSVTGEARAAFCGMGVCHECRVAIDGRAHVLACQTLCRDGLVVETAR